MGIDREEMLERVLTSYSNWYNIDRDRESELPLAAFAEFHEHGTGYLLVRKAEMWAADRHEYVWFFNVPQLTRETAERAIALVREEGEPMVVPHKNHRSTYLCAVFICDSADEDAKKVIRSLRVRKSFQFSLQGWMEVQAAAVEIEGLTVTANAAAYNTAKFLKSVASPGKQRKRKFLKLF